MFSSRQHGAGAAGRFCAAVPARTDNLDQVVVSVNEVPLRVGSGLARSRF